MVNTASSWAGKSPFSSRRRHSSYRLRMFSGADEASGYVRERLVSIMRREVFPLFSLARRRIREIRPPIAPPAAFPLTAFSPAVFSAAFSPAVFSAAFSPAASPSEMLLRTCRTSALVFRCAMFLKYPSAVTANTVSARIGKMSSTRRAGKNIRA